MGRPAAVAIKECARCGHVKPLGEFYRSGSSRDGYRHVCKACWNTEANARHERNRQRDMQVSTKKSTAWRHANPEKDRHQHVRRTYGISGEQYDAMLEAQSHACAICHRPFEKTPYVDHNHTCCAGGKSCGQCVRGLLCPACSAVLAHSGDSVERLLACIVYVIRGAP